MGDLIKCEKPGESRGLLLVKNVIGVNIAEKEKIDPPHVLKIAIKIKLNVGIVRSRNDPPAKLRTNRGI